MLENNSHLIIVLSCLFQILFYTTKMDTKHAKQCLVHLCSTSVNWLFYFTTRLIPLNVIDVRDQSFSLQLYVFCCRTYLATLVVFDIPVFVAVLNYFPILVRIILSKSFSLTLQAFDICMCFSHSFSTIKGTYTFRKSLFVIYKQAYDMHAINHAIQ